MYKSKNRKAVITGATGDIGYAIAECLSALNFDLVLMGRDFSQYNNFSAPHEKVEVDFSHVEELPDLLTSLARSQSDVDTLICCAGRGDFAALEEFSYARMRSLMELNFLSQAYVVRAFIPYLKQKDHSDLILLGSEAAVAGGKQGSMYCASKFALRGFAQSLRQECAKSEVRVTMINPGMVKTAFFDPLEFAPGEDESNYLEPVDVANAVKLILCARQGTVYDEINISPMKRVVRRVRQE